MILIVPRSIQKSASRTRSDILDQKGILCDCRDLWENLTMPSENFEAQSSIIWLPLICWRLSRHGKLHEIEFLQFPK